MSGFFKKHPGQRDDAGLSVDLWGDCPRHEIEQDLSAGYFFKDNFTDLPSGRYTATQAGSAGTFALADAARGVAIADAGDEDDGDGINVQKVGELFIPAADRKIWFEARVNHKTALTTPADFFLGLSETDGTIIGSSANTSANHIGFESVSEDGVLAFVSEKAGSRHSEAAVHTFEADTFTKLGFKVLATNAIQVFLNGVHVATITDAADIPIVEMTLSLVCQAASTPAGSGSGPKIHIDWWECYQLHRA